MSSVSILKDGNSICEYYGSDLDKLTEGDRIGVLRTPQDELVFYINGVSQGVAATKMPKTIYPIVNLYGQCVQVTIRSNNIFTAAEIQSQDIAQLLETPIYTNCPGLPISNGGINDSIPSIDSVCASTTGIDSEGACAAIASTSHSSSNLNNVVLHDVFLDTTTAQHNSTIETFGTSVVGVGVDERLCFHNRCGSLVKLSANFRTAERRRPFDEFNNGVVMTHRPLNDNELFEIRIDKLVDKWSGSIEVGVTTHNPSALHFPATMTNMRSGTIMMSGCGILTNGKGTRREYGEFNLDELREGDRVGMMRKSNGNLHYYINGQDQGVAATRVAQTLWGVIDLYGMTIKVTIVDRDEREQQNLVTRRNNIMTMQIGPEELPTTSPDTDFIQSNDRLTFHYICGSHASVTHSGRTALRPK